MPKVFEIFADSLGLRPPEAADLKAELERDAQADAVTPVCIVAQKLLGPEVVDTKPANKDAVDANWSAACWEQPTCIIHPKTAQDVATALKIIAQFEAPFAVRSGGHSPNPGFSSITDPGILIDLSGLAEITVSDDRETVSIGPGQRWGNVYDALDPYGVSVIGGRIPNVGVGGLMLGGHYWMLQKGTLQNRLFLNYALQGDITTFPGDMASLQTMQKASRFVLFNIAPMVSALLTHLKVVLADGTIANATATQNSDLFWALKGGGPNFGIVTRYDLYTVPVHDIWYEVLAVSNDDAHAVLDAFAVWQNTTASSDTKGTVALVLGLQSITLGFIYSEPVTERPSVFAAFSGIKPLVTAVPPTNGTVASISAILSTTSSVARHDYRSAASKIDAQLYKDVYDFWLGQATAVNAATGANQTFALQPVPRELVEAGEARGGNPMGWTTLIDWEKAADDKAVRDVSIATAEKWKELGQERGLYVDYLYTNDASRDQGPMSTYGGANVTKLKGIALKYDPEQLFQTLQHEGFLLRKI